MLTVQAEKMFWDCQNIRDALLTLNVFVNKYVVQNCQYINQSVIVGSGVVNILTINFDIEFFLKFVTGQGCYEYSM